MENATTAEEGLIVHNHIAAQQHIVRDDHLVADNAVVSDMRIDHEKIIISNLGRAVSRCSTMNGTLLANDVAFADFHPTWRGRRKTKVLWFPSDHGAVPDSIPLTDGYFPFDHDIRANPRPRTDDGSQVNHFKALLLP